eukprot:TRINITY_DN8039_c3_g1_i1.p1 TRINITY_DN8039_c3_g1~~TRINITY_DN8039_c3_g1_i1.p1  ORF type:complete len:1015 (+),score=338.19 TRINITY_DN8039_c3_g1_i1:91-3045(+)
MAGYGSGDKNCCVVEVLYPYSAAEKNQISLQPHEKITVLEKDKSGWWIGRRDGTGEVGIFPSTYVHEIADRLKFNRPKELKQLPIGGGGGRGEGRRDQSQQQRSLKAELGFDDSDSGDDARSPDSSPGRGRGGGDQEGQRELRRQLHELKRRCQELDHDRLVMQEDKVKAEKDVADFRRQVAILKKQQITAHEKMRQLKYDLEEAHGALREDGKDAPRPPYRQEPDAAVEAWLESAIEAKCYEDRQRIKELEIKVEELEEKLGEGDESPTSAGGRAQGQKRGAGAADASPKSAQNGQRAAGISGRIREGDTVRRSQSYDDSDDDDGVLHSGALGVVVEIIHDAPAGKPFLVREAGKSDSATTWYCEAALEFVKAAPAAGAGAAAPSAEQSAEVAAAMKEKDKKIKKLEKKLKVLEEDLNALEKYNTKLEKKLDKAKKKEGVAADGGREAEAVKQLQKDLAAHPPGEAPMSPPPAGADPDALRELRSRAEVAEAERDELRQRMQKTQDVDKEIAELRKQLGAAKAAENALAAERSSHAAAGSALQEELDAARKELASQQAASEQAAKDAEAGREAAVAAEKAAVQHALEAQKQADELRRQLGDWAAEKQKLEKRAVDAEREARETIERNAAELKHAVDRYKREEKRRREFYNQLMELKGNIRVYCRLKPCIGDEKNECISFDDDMTCRVQDPQSAKSTTYEFDMCFTGEAKQEDVYADVKGLAVSVLDGYHVCIFAYGQTGSGKTYTMEGPPDNRGVNFRTVEDLFLQARERVGEYTYEMSVSILEVYNDHVYDLQGKRCEVKVMLAGKDEGVKVEPLVRVPVSSTEQVADALAAAYTHRSVAGTSMNAHSSRSHCILSVWIEGRNEATGAKIRGKLHLIDLAGSERLKQSQAEGDRLVEATHINKSLTTLGLCINSLANKKEHIPYRNSKLTYLLQDSLGGNCKCLMFANISPASSNVPETISTLKFATNARKVDLGKAEKMKS